MAPTNPPRHGEVDYVADSASAAGRLASQTANQKTPTIPIYDSDNFPDDAVDGQLARDINDLDVLWQYQGEESGGDNAWHQIGGPTETIARYFSISMDVSVLWAVGPYGGLSDKTINWATDSSTFNVWTTNDTPDGSVVTQSADTPWDTGDIFEYDNTVGDVIETRGAGAYMAYAMVDLRQDSAYDAINIVNKWHVIGIENLHLMQSPQKRDTLDHTTYGYDGKIDISQNVLLEGAGVETWALRYGHNIPGNIRFKARFSLMRVGSFL